MRTVLRRSVLAGLVLFALLQLVPYGWWHENPPERSVAAIRDPRAASLFEAACADCHSNRTDWPIYSYVAPVSWLVRRDVEDGRRAFNVSEYATSEHDADDAADEIEDGSMPPSQYTLLHPAARLSAEERATLIEALEQLADATDDDDDENENEDEDENEDRGGTNSGPG